MTVLATKNQGMATANAVARGVFSEQQVAILRSSYAKNLDAAEFQVFLATASHLKLNPFAREIYAIKYGNQMSLVTSIDGYRKMSARSGRFLGVTQGRLRVRSSTGESITVPHDEYDPDEHKIISGTIGIRVLDYPEPVEATAVFKTYNKNTPNWRDMPDTMILKCAEAAAHRKAALLPDVGLMENVASVYVEDEVRDYSVVDVQPAPVETPKVDIAKHVASRRVQIKDSIVESVEAPKKSTPAPEPVVLDAPLPPLEPEVVAEIKQALEPTASEALMEKVRQAYTDWGCHEEGLMYLENRILDIFAVEDIAQITDTKRLQKLCREELKRELEQENYLPMRLNKEE